ncbi:MAG: ATP-binding protein [[Clostridium] scindens]
MKNISAAELNFDSEEITERFVRGDSARNTEGSGLGLAIVKSFTELGRNLRYRQRQTCSR